MRNYIKNIIKDRLTNCKEWENNVEIYLHNRELTKKTDFEHYKSRPILRLILNLYFLPYNILKQLNYIRIMNEYKKNKIEIEILSKEIKVKNIGNYEKQKK